MAYSLFQPQRSRPVRGVLFDMDGVILDTEKLYTRFWQEAGIACGYPMTREHALGMRSLNRAAGEVRLKSWFGPELNYEQVRLKRCELMDAYIAKHGVEPKPGIRELLAYLQTHGIPAAITTATPIDRVLRHLTPLGLEKSFAAIRTAQDVPCGKPAPDIYLAGAAALNLPPESCLALEDSPVGILAAHGAGCMDVMVPDQDQPDEDTKSLLFGLADSLMDVIDLLESLRRNQEAR